MFRLQPSLLARLRRHRGLWVLAVAVLLVKLASSSICLGDIPKAELAGSNAAVIALVVMDSTTLGTPDENPCLLGEVADCHCACAHAVPLTAHVTRFVASIDARAESFRLAPDLVAETTGSLLRPPIA